MKKKWIAVGLKLLVSVALIWWLLGTIDLAAAKDRLLLADPALLAAACGLVLVQFVIGGFRWRAVLVAMGVPLPVTTATRLFYIGTFFNQTLPSSVGGDAVRMSLAHRAGLRVGPAIGGVMLERVVTVVALVVLVLAVQPWFLPRLQPAEATLTATALGILAGGTTVGLALLVLLDRPPEGFRRWRLGRGIAGLGGDARRVFLVPRNALVTLVWGLFTHANMGLIVYTLGQSLDLNIGLVDCMVLTPPVLLVTTLPISIAGWGVREGAMVFAFALIGVPREAALVLSLLLGLVALAMALPGGLVWLMTRGGDTDDDAAFAEQAAGDAGDGNPEPR